MAHPINNGGVRQYCELDHLVPLSLGGADTLDNIWPQCVPARFRGKDRVERYLVEQVRAGNIGLDEAQHGIAEDWTQYIRAATRRTSPVANSTQRLSADEVMYENCAAARAAGAAPIRRGEPGYRPGLDGDGDGVACDP